MRRSRDVISVPPRTAASGSSSANTSRQSSRSPSRITTDSTSSQSCGRDANAFRTIRSSAEHVRRIAPGVSAHSLDRPTHRSSKGKPPKATSTAMPPSLFRSKTRLRIANSRASPIRGRKTASSRSAVGPSSPKCESTVTSTSRVRRGSPQRCRAIPPMKQNCSLACESKRCTSRAAPRTVFISERAVGKTSAAARRGQTHSVPAGPPTSAC